PANKPYPAVKEEWSREMRRLESFRHPNIVYIHDAFEANFLFYLALEKCDTSLKALLTRPGPGGTAPQPLAYGLLIELSRQLLMPIQSLHGNGVVHSDLHAGNVLISQIDSAPIVKLTDFGVAHQLGGGERWFRPQVANPKILTPELVTAGYTTTQSDLYQLGLLMYQMHTGSIALEPTPGYPDVTRLIAEGIPRQKAESLGTPLSRVIAK